MSKVRQAITRRIGQIPVPEGTTIELKATGPVTRVIVQGPRSARTVAIMNLYDDAMTVTVPGVRIILKSSLSSSAVSQFLTELPSLCWTAGLDTGGTERQQPTVWLRPMK